MARENPRYCASSRRCLIPTRGRAEVRGFDVAREPAKVRLQIGYHTGGDACFYSRLSARENLVLFAGLNNLSERGSIARRIAELTGPFGLGELLDRQVRTLSTGNIHRLGLARAMLHRPSVLILDEPTRSLDPLAAAEFRRFLLQDIVGGHGTTMIFASHTLAEVEQLAGKIAVLDGGRLLACDTLAGIKTSAGADTLGGITGNSDSSGSAGNTMSGSPQFVLTLRKLALLFRRDLAVARSYRAAFVIEIFQALFGSASFYFLSRFVESSGAGKIASARRNLFFIRAGGNCLLRLPERRAQHF